MKWSPEFATGVERIDEQHRILFRMSEDYRIALEEEGGARVYGGLLESLDRYARAHFGFEERCMHRYRCPAAEANSTAHLTFVQTLEGFRERYAAHGFEREAALRLVRFVDDWLASHIGRIDTQLKPCVERDDAT